MYLLESALSERPLSTRTLQALLRTSSPPCSDSVAGWRPIPVQYDVLESALSERPLVQVQGLKLERKKSIN